jgi:hypothetical protein
MVCGCLPPCNRRSLTPKDASTWRLVRTLLLMSASRSDVDISSSRSREKTSPLNHGTVVLVSTDQACVLRPLMLYKAGEVGRCAVWPSRCTKTCHHRVLYDWGECLVQCNFLCLMSRWPGPAFCPLLYPGSALGLHASWMGCVELKRV